jgi:hypothetical protein
MENPFVEKEAPPLPVVVKVTEEGRNWFNVPLLKDLRAWYRGEGTQLPDRELFLKIEECFGDRLVREVCIPRKVYALSCILAAIELIKEPEGEHDRDGHC